MAQSLKLSASPDELRAGWADAGQRNLSLSASTGERAGVRCRKLQLAERDIVGAATCSFAELAAQAGQPDADPFALLCHLAFQPAGRDEAARSRVLTRRRRANQMTKKSSASRRGRPRASNSAVAMTSAKSWQGRVAPVRCEAET